MFTSLTDFYTNQPRSDANLRAFITALFEDIAGVVAVCEVAYRWFHFIDMLPTFLSAMTLIEWKWRR